MRKHPPDGQPFAGDPTDEQWTQARRCARALDRILDTAGPRRILIARAAMELRLSIRQIYYFLARYRDDRTVTSLLPRTGRARQKRLPRKTEAIIAETLREQWLVLEAPPLAPVVAEIRARCQEAGLFPPSHVTIARRIAVLFTPEEIAKGRSVNPQHLHRLKPRPGYIHAPRPLDVCQIDHTPTDINFIEVIDSTKTFVGRAYLTIVTDVFSRCIAGFCLTLEKPSALSVALCLAHTLCPKEAWLAARGIDHPWPVFGRPRRLVTDSAREFKGLAFQRGCEDYGIDIQYRDRGRVHHGGVVERLLGKLNAVIAIHPGSTGRSVADRDEYPSQGRACLSFADLERCMALAVIDHNLHENAKTLKVPMIEWQAHARSVLRFNDDPHRVLIMFLPAQERCLTPQGIRMFALFYYAPWIGGLVPHRDRLGTMEVRYDPRDISHIYVRDPASGEFQPVGRRDGTATPMTLWEHEKARSDRRRANSRSDVEKVHIRRQIAAIAQTAKDKKTRLRHAARASRAADALKPYEAIILPAPSPAEHPVRQKRPLPVEEW